MKRRQIVLRGLVASVALAAFGVSFNMMTQTSQSVQAKEIRVNEVLRDAEEIAADPASPQAAGGDELSTMSPRTRAVEEHGEEAPPPAPVEERIASSSGGLDVNNVFNKVWGLFQGIVLAWVGFKFNGRRKEKMMTETGIDRRVDKRMAEEYARMQKDRRKK